MVARNTEDFWIKHLVRRAGFGATPAELRHYGSLGFAGAVEELVNPERVDNSKLEELVSRQNFDFTQAQDLKRWWLFRMTFSRRPLEEKMTLYWHGHFATSIRKVQNAYAMYMQNLLLRQNALGDFHRLLLSISRDPAMILWLDNQQNRRGKPNENFARELMELFTMGIGNYTERDVKEAARAFTGWQLRPGGFFFNQRQHDVGAKTVLGVSGPLNGDDVVSILVRRPETARYLARKLITFFVMDSPDESYVRTVADAYLSSRYQIRPMLKAVFTHPHFRSDRAYHGKIKSPAELVVGALKTLQVESLDGDLPMMMARMGQNLFEPPSVKGWDGGAAWVSTDTMMERFNFAAWISGQKFDELNGFVRPSQLVAGRGLSTAGAVVDYFLAELVDADVPSEVRKRLVAYMSSDNNGTAIERIPDDTILDTKLRGLVRLIMTLPTFQLS